MLRKIFFPIACIIFLGFYHLAFAGLVINEIMYDLDGTDTGREWVEVYNNSESVLDISNYKFFESSTNHGLTLYQGVATLSAHGYAVIVADHTKFKIDWPTFSGTIFDSSFTLDNTGEALAIKDATLSVVDQYTYSSTTGANGDGKSLQKISGSWASALPTPGATNETASTSSSGIAVNVSSSDSSSNATELKNKNNEDVKIKTRIIAKTPIFVGSAVEFTASSFGRRGEPLHFGKYFLNFGDGDSKESALTDGEKFMHTYFYPGEYNVNLEYYQNYYSDVPDATDKIYIRVVGADVVISSVGDEHNFFIELTNNTDFEADLSMWMLVAGEKSFTLPKNTTLKSKNKTTIPAKVSSFSIADKDNLKLINSQGDVVFEFKPQSQIVENKTKNYVKVSGSPVAPVVLSVAKIENTNKMVAREAIDLPVSSELATAVASDVMPNKINPPYIPVALVLFLGVSAGAVYFVRQKKVVNVGDDFSILDE